MSRISKDIEEIYRILYNHYGPQGWWPADSPFEVMVGAVLTQNTSWQNVDKAIAVLKERKLLSLKRLVLIDEQELAGLIRASGYYNLKARRLKNLLLMIERQFDGDLDRLFETGIDAARESLLAVKGIGPETADSILLYAGNLPVFVIDAYTHRLFSRHHLVPEECDYQTMQELFMDCLPEDAVLFNEYHALIVATVKEFCKKNNPRCAVCPLAALLP